MTGKQLRLGRESKGWTQQQAAERLGVSQPYLSLLENGTRRLTGRLARRSRALYNLSPVALPLKSTLEDVYPVEGSRLAGDLAVLGYPGFSYLRGGHMKNPAEVVASALKNRNLEVRVTEALPWLLAKYPDLDWEWLVRAAKVHDLQNRLGFLTTVACRLAQKHGEEHAVEVLAQKESELKQSRLVGEDTLCHESLSETEREWLRKNRSPEARQWNLLTDLSAERLSYET